MALYFKVLGLYFMSSCLLFYFILQEETLILQDSDCSYHQTEASPTEKVSYHTTIAQENFLNNEENLYSKVSCLQNMRSLKISFSKIVEESLNNTLYRLTNLTTIQMNECGLTR